MNLILGIGLLWKASSPVSYLVGADMYHKTSSGDCWAGEKTQSAGWCLPSQTKYHRQGLTSPYPSEATVSPVGCSSLTWQQNCPLCCQGTKGILTLACLDLSGDYFKNIICKWNRLPSRGNSCLQNKNFCCYHHCLLKAFFSLCNLGASGVFIGKLYKPWNGCKLHVLIFLHFFSFPFIQISVCFTTLALGACGWNQASILVFI